MKYEDLDKIQKLLTEVEDILRKEDLMLSTHLNHYRWHIVDIIKRWFFEDDSKN